MKKRFWVLIVAAAAVFLLPLVSLASSQKTLSGTVTKISGSGVVFTNSTAASYYADLGNAVMVRKNGVAMKFSEILVGDKIQVSGTLWADNSLSAANFKDISLYSHNSSFTGKIIGINPSDLSFTIQSKENGDQTIHTSNFTAIYKNGSSAAFNNLELGMSATVKGMWDRSSKDVLATQVKASLRLIDIYFTGTLMVKDSSGLTVVGNGNVIYGVDISQAKLMDKNGLALQLFQMNNGDSMRVWGKHVSGSVKIIATQVKDASFWQH